MQRSEITIPTVVRVKAGALERIGIYLERCACKKVVFLYSDGLDSSILSRAKEALRLQGILTVCEEAVSSSGLEDAERIFADTASLAQAVVGLGGGKALDVAKYIGFLLQKPYFSVPTSLSNDGFCSPQSSLTIKGKRFSLPSAMPYGVVVDTEVCLKAPISLWWSGVGDLAAKCSAVQDWKLAFRNTGLLVDDFAALVADSSVYQFMSHPERDLEGVQLLATALMLDGISMAVCGSSRPASGSEHLISHALDAISARPRLHGLQVGIATYLVSHLHPTGATRVKALFDATKFWDAIREDPFSRKEWEEAIKIAPSIKPDLYTILSTGDRQAELLRIIDKDLVLEGCFV